MESRALWIAFFITIQFSAVLGKNPFYEYFYNKYHHKDHHSSTTEEISSVSGDFEIIEHLSAGHSENIIQSSTGEFELTKYSFQDNDDTSMTPPTLQYGDHYGSTTAQKNAVFIAVTTTCCFLVISLCCGCICFFIQRSRRNRVKRGRVLILNRPVTATEVPPEQPELAQQRVFAQQQRQPLVIQQYLQPVTTQHHQQQQFSGEHMQDPAPYYQSHPVQQQHPPTLSSQNPAALSSQTSPTQDHSQNPPESPTPAYDFPEKFE